MFCPNCGNESNDGALFCPSCGYRFRTENPQEEYKETDFNSASNESWYYLEDGERTGPVSEKQVADLIKNGIINRDTMVWKQGLNGWTRIENTIFSNLTQQFVPATPMSALSDKWLWSLATVPLSVDLVLTAVNPMIDDKFLTAIVLFLNLIFVCLDERHLRHNGIKTRAWMWTGFLLVPVYLFVRASKTNKNIVPGIFWCVLYILDVLLSFYLFV
ncbi:MAG: GYF domain-containing protein [Clostridia bacterium]|nr:GYF domain-containing protein [Clostridia bacterium]